MANRIPRTDRFHNKYTKSEDPDGCWIWNGRIGNHGYGMIAKGAPQRGFALAHRVSFEIHKGQIPEALLICHTCDVTACVNPDHLFLGTKKTNALDMMLKGRSSHVSRNAGVKHNLVKLTEDQVRSIRVDKRSGPLIASEYGIHPSNVNYIRSLKTWRHLK